MGRTTVRRQFVFLISLRFFLNTKSPTAVGFIQPFFIIKISIKVKSVIHELGPLTELNCYCTDIKRNSVWQQFPI